MNLILINIIMLLFCALSYSLFRQAVYYYCRMSKMRKRDIRKALKGASNFWLYTDLHKQKNLGALYYLNYIYIICYVSFFISSFFSGVPYLKWVTVVLGILLGIMDIPIGCAFRYYDNLEYLGKPFVWLKVYSLFSKKAHRVFSVLDWIYPAVPLAVYIIYFITNI